MKITIEQDARDFEYWSGAKTNIEAWENCLFNDDMEIIYELIEDTFADQDEVTDTMVNDFVWFELDDLVAEMYPELYAQQYGEE